MVFASRAKAPVCDRRSAVADAAGCDDRSPARESIVADDHPRAPPLKLPMARSIPRLEFNDIVGPVWQPSR
jgi:hypothetical protein